MRAKLAKCERAALGQPSSSCDSTRAPSRIARSPDLTRRQSITTACAVNAQPQPGIRICRASSRRSVLMPCRRRDRRWSPPRRQGLGKSREGVACQIGRHLDLQRPRPPRETDSPLERRGFELPVPPARMSLDFSRKEGAAGRIRVVKKAPSSRNPPSCFSRIPPAW